MTAMNSRWSIQILSAAALGTLAWLGSGPAALKAQEPAAEQEPGA